MAGTMPHAIFVETGLDGGATVAAYAAELPGCAVFAPTDEEATAEMPRRVGRFVDWLRASGEEAPTFVGDNWYEVERAAAAGGERASFSLDDLPPSAEELPRLLRWLELAREALADALDGIDEAAPPRALERIERQDRALAGQLGGADGAGRDERWTDRPPVRRAGRADGRARGGGRHCRRRTARDPARDRR